MCYHTCMKNQIASDIFHYHTNWKEGKVNQMWIEEIDDGSDIFQYVAVAYNPITDDRMEVSNPRSSYYETLQWVRSWCGTFCILPV